MPLRKDEELHVFKIFRYTIKPPTLYLSTFDMNLSKVNIYQLPDPQEKTNFWHFYVTLLCFEITLTGRIEIILSQNDLLSVILVFHLFAVWNLKSGVLSLASYRKKCQT